MVEPRLTEGPSSGRPRWPIGENEDLRLPSPISWRRVVAICVLIAFALFAVLVALFVSAVGSILSCRGGCRVLPEVLLPIGLVGGFAGAILLVAVRATPILARPDHPDRHRRPYEIGLTALWGMAGMGAGFSYIVGAFGLAGATGGVGAGSGGPTGLPPLAWLGFGGAAMASAVIVTTLTVRHVAATEADPTGGIHRLGRGVVAVVTAAHAVLLLGGGPRALGLGSAAVLAALAIGIGTLAYRSMGPTPEAVDDVDGEDEGWDRRSAERRR